MGRAGRGAGEPGPASGVAAPRTQRGPGRGGRPPALEAASEPACGSPPAPLTKGRGTMNEEEEDGKGQESGRRVGRRKRKEGTDR